MAIVGTGAGCTSATSVPGEGRDAAHVRIENRTDYVWQVTFARTGSAKVTVDLPARRSVRVELVAGAYHVEQRVQQLPQADHLAQTLTADFEAGRTYRWPLVTLLSESSSSP